MEIYTNLSSKINTNKEEKNTDNTLNNDFEKQQEIYEILIRKLESDLRNHLKV